MSKKFRKDVGALGLNSLVNVLKTDYSDTEIISYVLDTLCNVCSPEDWEEEVVEEEHDDLTGVGEGLSEMFLKQKENIGLVLQCVEEFDFKIRRPAVQLLSDLLTNCQREVQQQVLDSHVGVSRLMDVLSETREVLRNDALILLFKLTKGNANLQKIVAFENAFDKLFEIMEAEGWTDGGIVVEDCLRLLLNLLRNNPSNQTFFKEGSYINRIRPGLEVIQTDDFGWDAQKVANMLHILQLVRTLNSPTNPGQVTTSCQQATFTSGVMAQLTQILLASGIPADVLTETINTLAEVIRGDNANQQRFMEVSAPSQPPRPAIILLLMSMVNDKQPFSLRCAVLYCFQSYLHRHPAGQAAIVASLLPTAPGDPATDVSAGQLLCGGLFSGEPVSNWLCSAALSHVFMDNPGVQVELLRVQLATVPGAPPVSLLAQTVRLLQHLPSSAMTARLGLLQLLCAWVAGCPQAVALLLSTPDSLSFILNQIQSNEHDETERLGHGLCSVLMGLCILHNDNSVAGHTVSDLSTLVEKRIGSDTFLDKISNIPKHESYIKALKSPQLRCGSIGDLVFDHKFCELFRSIDRDITGIIMKGAAQSMSDSNGPTANESADVEIYKNFIREQEVRMNQFVEANNLLKVELTNLKTAHVEVQATVDQLRDQAAILQAQALNAATNGPTDAGQEPGGGETTVSHGAGLRRDHSERQVRHKDEYIAELEARLEREVTEVAQVNDNFKKLVEIHEAQSVEVKTLKKQCENMRGILMNKDEEIMKLKNDLPIKPKDGGTDRFENMFMTSLEVDAQNKGLKGLELELKLEELERMKAEHQKEVQALEEERNGLENEVRESRHKIDELEEKAALVDPVRANAQETELRDLRCKVEELQAGCDDRTLQENDSTHIAELLRGTEQQLNETREQLRMSMEQVEAMKKVQVAEITKEKEEGVRELKEKLEEAASEQEDLLVMLAEQEEKLGRMKSRLRELGEVVSDAEEDEEDI